MISKDQFIIITPYIHYMCRETRLSPLMDNLYIFFFQIHMPQNDHFKNIVLVFIFAKKKKEGALHAGLG